MFLLFSINEYFNIITIKKINNDSLNIFGINQITDGKKKENTFKMSSGWPNDFRYPVARPSISLRERGRSITVFPIARRPSAIFK